MKPPSLGPGATRLILVVVLLSTRTAALSAQSGLTGFSSRLPILVLDTHGSGPLVKDGVDRASTLELYRPAAAGVPTFARLAELTTSATLSVRGSSSAHFPKKSYTLTLRDSQGRKRAQPLLDLPAAESWTLIAPWSYDPGYINNALVYELSNQLGRWAPRTRFVEVFVNSDGGDVTPVDYAGLYVLTDRIEPGENRVAFPASQKHTAARESGYLFKIDSADADEFSWDTARGLQAKESRLVLVAPKADDSTESQRDFIRTHVQQLEDALHADAASGWVTRSHLGFIDRSAWVDHHLLNTFACNPDALIRSAYFTKMPGGRIAAGPVWDFDRALGSESDLRSYRWNVWSGVGASDVWHAGWWGILARDPEFMQEWIDRWQSLRRNEFSATSLAERITNLGRAIGPEAAARDALRWPENSSFRGSHAAQLEHMSSWLGQRALWIDEQFVAPPFRTIEATNATFTAPAGAVLVYTLDGSDPRSLGGAIAPNAEATSAPLVVSRTANVHVRSYRPDQAGAFPGSPWSSALGTDAATPLLPRAQIVNLSIRAVTGRDDDTLIIGVGIADTVSKRYLARAVGPGLAAFGVSSFAMAPQLSIATGGVERARNAGWETSHDVPALIRETKSVGAFPLAAGSADAALLPEFTSLTSTVNVSSAPGGVVLAELYALNDIGRSATLSARARVRGGDGVLVSGFVIQGPASQRVLIRAVGPGLRELGITDPLAFPVLTLCAGSRTVAGNARWSTAPNAVAIERAAALAGAFPLNPETADAALLVTLPPGAYTAEVSGRGAEGIVLLEIHDVP